MKHAKGHYLILLYFGHVVQRIQNVFWGLDWENELLYAQVTGIQLESSEVFVGGEPAQRGAISLYYYSARLEARWISGCMWSSLWYCRNVWVSAEVSQCNIYIKKKSYLNTSCLLCRVLGTSWGIVAVGLPCCFHWQAAIVLSSEQVIAFLFLVNIRKLPLPSVW